MSPRWLHHTLAVLLVIGSLLIALVSTAPRPASAIGSADGSDIDQECEAILTRAVTLTGQDCSTTGRNQACYGYTAVQSSLQPGVDVAANPFAKGGDILPVRVIQSLSTSRLNIDDGTWGMALLKMQANLPDTNPGQNVTFILFGDTTFQPDTEHTNAFYLSTDLGELNCKQIPQNSMLVRAPGNVTVSFEVNGVQISASSVVVLRSSRSGQFLVRTLEGHVTVTAAGETQQLWAGQELTVPLAGPDFHSPAGPPTQPVAAPWESALEAPTELLNAVDPTADTYIGPITLEGPIEAMNRDIPSLTLYGQIVRLGNLSCWRTLHAGDWVYIEGNSLGNIIDATKLTSDGSTCPQNGVDSQVVPGTDGEDSGFMLICHVPAGNPAAAHTLRIPVSAWKTGDEASGGHGLGRHGGDYAGACHGQGQGKGQGQGQGQGQGGGQGQGQGGGGNPNNSGKGGGK